VSVGVALSTSLATDKRHINRQEIRSHRLFSHFYPTTPLPIILKLGFCSVAVFYSTPVGSRDFHSQPSNMSNINVGDVGGGGRVPFFLRLYLCLWRCLYRFLSQQCEFLFTPAYIAYKPCKVIVEALCVDKSCRRGKRKCRRG